MSLAGLVVGVALFASACSTASATPANDVAGATAVPPAGQAPSAITLASTNDPTLGAYLTGQNGMTLYVLTKDGQDMSSCSGSCATNWPPLAIAAGGTVTGPSGASGAFAMITRADGTIQVTYNHMPLYYYSGDSKAGDTNGQNKNNVWFVAPASGSLAPAAVTPAAATSTAPPATDKPVVVPTYSY